MKNEILRRRGIYSGTVCDLVRKKVGNQLLSDIIYVEERACIKVDDNTFFDYDNKVLLPVINIKDGVSNYTPGRYFISPVYEDKLDAPFIFSKDENGHIEFCSFAKSNFDNKAKSNRRRRK